MDFMQQGEVLILISFEPFAGLLDVSTCEANQPHHNDQQHGYIYIVDEETGHAGALESPGERL